MIFNKTNDESLNYIKNIFFIRTIFIET